jgi:hypothetical protein
MHHKIIIDGHYQLYLAVLFLVKQLPKLSILKLWYQICKAMAMKAFLSITLSVMLIAVACRNNNSPQVSAIIDSDARNDNVVTDTKGPATLPHMDTTKLVVDSAVNITVNDTPLQKRHNVVYRALYDNWLHAYSEVQHLTAVLHITYIGTVMMGARGDIMDQVLQAQTDMKQYIARDKYKKPYDSLSSGQQTEMQQEHGILFQKEFR